MDTLCTSGFNSRIISIETLNYPIEWVEEILIDFNLAVCMDLGHLILYGSDMKDFLTGIKTELQLSISMEPTKVKTISL